MKKIYISILILVVLIAAATLWLQESHPSYTVRYKVTVEIETPEGVKSGSSVWELSAGTPLIKFPDAGNPAGRRGEAVIVDLGKRGVVFALMSDQSWENGLYQAFPTQAPSSKRGIEYYQKTLKVGMKAEWREYKPSMVTFTDLNDPKSVKGINREDMSEAFGMGVNLKQITVEITNDPVTWNMIDKYLSDDFWDKYKAWVKSTKITEREFTRLFRFKQGDIK